MEGVKRGYVVMLWFHGIKTVAVISKCSIYHAVIFSVPHTQLRAMLLASVPHVACVVVLPHMKVVSH